jgi:uncharacterized damage-inducible protein DinB
MIHDTSHGNRWHRITTATEGLEDEDLAYKPVPQIGCDWGEREPWPRIGTPQSILQHMAWAATMYANGLSRRRGDQSATRWIKANLASVSNNAEQLVASVDQACGALHTAASGLSDAELTQPSSGVWDNAFKGFVLVDGGVLHTAWHLGQLAMLCQWRRVQEKEELTRPSAPAGDSNWPGDRDWTDFRVGSRTEACLRVLKAAYEESPWHSLRQIVDGISAAELAWQPFPGQPSARVKLHHVAHCKLMYADHALGEHKLQWGDCDRLLGLRQGDTSADSLLAALGRAQESLAEHVAKVTDEAIDQVYPMHHGIPHAGWQVVASMAQHDAWHAGQISIMRDAYAALAGG